MITFPLNGKTSFLFLHGRHICPPFKGHQHGVPILSSMNLSETVSPNNTQKNNTDVNRRLHLLSSYYFYF